MVGGVLQLTSGLGCFVRSVMSCFGIGLCGNCRERIIIVPQSWLIGHTAAFGFTLSLSSGFHSLINNTFVHSASSLWHEKGHRLVGS